jgi:hypothetical protein
VGNFPFDRCVINTRERPLSSDIDRGFSLVAQTLSELMDRLTQSRASFGDDTASQVASAGFNGDGFKVRSIATPAMQIRASQGLGWFFDPTADVSVGAQPGLDDRARLRPLVLPSDEVINVPAAPAGGTERYDIVEVALGRLLTDQVSRNVLTAISPFVFNPTLVNKTMTFDLNGQSGVVAAPSASTAPLSLKTGVVAPTGTAVVPPTTAGYVKLAEIYVGGAVTAIQPNVIRDKRKLLAANAQFVVGVEFSVLNINTPVPSITALNAPPGVQVSVYAEQFNRGYVDVYVICGGGIVGWVVGATLTQVVATESLVSLANAAGPQIIDASGNPTFGMNMINQVVDPTGQVRLAGPNASPNVQAAVGQVVSVLRLVPKTTDSNVSAFAFDVQLLIQP